MRDARDAPEASPRGVMLRLGTVVDVRPVHPGLLEVDVHVDGKRASALAYPDLVGDVAPGDEVVLNTTAVALGLGTGGYHLVVAVDGSSTDPAGVGRTMKLRYTPSQVAVRAIEETHRDLIERSPGLAGTPVVCAPLHSMIAPAAAGAKAAGARAVVYVMTDGAALPGPYSRLVPSLRDAGLLDGWITSGQAFGGDVEAVTVWTALIAAVEVLHADVVIVADGPGNLGTETTWGVSALTNGHALNAAAALRGRPVAALRISFADPRERHRGVSHHSLTILERVCPSDANVAVPVLEADQRDVVWNDLRSRRLEERHQLVETDGRPALEMLSRRGVAVRSMDRTASDDPAFFLSAGAAGVLAARMASGRRAWARRIERSGDPEGG
jgi:hypothetical protein